MIPTKDELRRQLRGRRRARTPEQREAAAHAIAASLPTLPPLGRRCTVGMYLSVRAELPSEPLLAALAEHTLAAPAVAPGGHMVFRTLDAPVAPGLLGIPDATGREVVPDVVIVPGLGWDAAGHRLGTGGGYYDRYLAGFAGAVVGVGPEVEVVPWVPTEAHDRGVGWLVTDARILEVQRPIRVGAAAWIRDGRVFVAQRRPGVARGGCWELPGGKIEAGESDAEGLVRELREELGVAVVADQPFAHSIHAYPEVTVHLVGMRVAGVGEPVLREHVACEWLGPDELHRVQWAPADVPLLGPLRALLAARSSS